MKKQISFSLVFSAFAVFYSLSSLAQQSSGETNNIASGGDAGSIKVNTAGYVNTYENMTEAGVLTTRIVKKFSRTYPQASNPKWTRIDNCYQVSFLEKGLKTTAVFQENGKMNYAITDLKIENMPAGLQQIIKKDYDGFRILNAVEINNNGNISRQVILENTASYITIKARGDEIEVIKVKNDSAGKYNQ